MNVAVIHIELLSLDGIPPNPHEPRDTGPNADPEAYMEFAFYLVAKIGQRFFGRSEPLKQSQTSFDFTQDQRTDGKRKRPRWLFKRQFRADEDVLRVPLVVEVWADQNADAQRSISRIETVLELPPVKAAGVVELRATSGGTKLKLRYTVKSTKPQSADSARDTPPHTLVINPSTLPVAVLEVTDIAGLHEPRQPLRWRERRNASSTDDAKDFRASGGSGAGSLGAAAASATINTREGHEATTPEGLYWEHRFSAPRRAYFDRDDTGRIFLNRDNEGRWLSRHQSIVLTAKVTMVRGKLPADAKMTWRVFAPDDPVTDHPDVRSEAWHALHHPYVATQSQFPVAGPRWEPNLGQVIPAQAWEAIAGFDLTDVDETSAATAIVNDTSRVRLHCPNHSGDRLVVEVSVSTKETIHCMEYVTGMLTTWHLIEVDYGALTGSVPLTDAFPRIAQNVAPACFQFDFIDHGVRDVPEGADSYAARAAEGEAGPGADWMRDRHLAYNAETETSRRATRLLVAEPELFPHRGQPGWFALAAALLLHPRVRTSGPGGEWIGQAYVEGAPGGVSRILIPPMPPGTPDVQLLEGGGTIGVTWGEDTIGFDVVEGEVSPLTLQQVEALRNAPRAAAVSPLSHRIGVDPQWLLPRFDVNQDLDTRNERNEWLQLYPADYVGEGPATVHLMWPGPSESTGPLGWSVGLNAGRFDGGLVILTRQSAFAREPADSAESGASTPSRDSSPWPPPIADFDYLVALVTVHEFSHSINTPHYCGHWSYRHGVHSCAMNAKYVQTIRRRGELIHGTACMDGPELCGVHISQMRRVIFQDNPVLSANGW
ncbi:MAG: hypothetical protein U0271_20215 [Polyangiaceae bacterium]